MLNNIIFITAIYIINSFITYSLKIDIIKLNKKSKLLKLVFLILTILNFILIAYIIYLAAKFMSSHFKPTDNKIILFFAIYSFTVFSAGIVGLLVPTYEKASLIINPILNNLKLYYRKIKRPKNTRL